MNERRQNLLEELQNMPPPNWTWIEGPQFPQEIIDAVKKKGRERLAREAKEKADKPEKEG